LRREVYGAYIAELIRHSSEGATLKVARDGEARFGILKRMARAVVFFGFGLLSRSYIVIIKGRPI
jgi:hypothetical protein